MELPRRELAGGGAVTRQRGRNNTYTSSRRYSTRPLHRPTPREKVSIGISCCRFNGNTLEILLVQKRYTYAFNAFVHSLYNVDNGTALMNLLNRMTVDEKIVLMRVDFRAAWSHIWLNPRFDSPKYRRMEEIFNANFKGNTRLPDAIARSATSGYRIWEIPKGRKKAHEADIHCAVREFYEETGVEKRHYTIFPLAHHSHSFIDDGVRYTQKYYFARADSRIIPRVRLGDVAQIEEVSDVRWFSMEELKFVDPSGHLVNSVRPVFNYMKKHTVRLNPPRYARRHGST